MRKVEREITDFNEKVKLLDRCQTIRLGISGGQFPYIVPLSFGYEVVFGKVNIYFHCAKEGKKVELLKLNNNVCIEADVLNGYTDTGHSVTADYESLIGFGKCMQVFGDEIVYGLQLLLNHCGVQKYSAQDCVSRGTVAVYKILVEEFTGKRRFMK